MTENYALFGNPVAHSKSPQIHHAFASQCRRDIHYDKILATEDNFTVLVQKFFAQGGAGCNVTVPFKQSAWQLCDQLSPAATRAGAANTLYLNDSGELCGHNTDGAGLVRDLTINSGAVLKGKHIMILGAGGATRGIIQPLAELQPAAITLVNRTRDRAEKLAVEFTDLLTINVSAIDEPAMQHPVDLLINATSASLNNNLPIVQPHLLGAHTFCYDLAYVTGPTVFMQWAQQHGAAITRDGLGMLVEQAAVSFKTWTGVQPETSSVIDSLRA